MGAAELRLGEGEFTWQIPANHGPAARIDGSILIKEDTLLNLDCNVRASNLLAHARMAIFLRNQPPISHSRIVELVGDMT